MNHKKLEEYKKIDIKKLEHKDIEYLLDLDHKIFEDYWKNSKSAFEETMKSCNNNYLFKSGSDGNLDGYAILGETRKFTYLQRIGITKNYQGSGLGNNLLNFIINFAIEKKFVNMKLNTQSDNIAALNLYRKNKFEISPRNLVIMKTS